MEIKSILRHYFVVFTKYFLVGILFIIGYNSCSSPNEVIIENTKEVIIRDTVTVIPEPERETVYIRSVDTVFVQVQDTIVRIETTHSDSALSATTRLWMSIPDYVVYDSDFYYVIKKRPIRYEFVNNTLTKYVYRQPKVPLLRLRVGAFTDFEEVYPLASLQIRDGLSFYYGYGVSTQSNLLGFTIPIK
jgi:hypothetical protein